MIEIRQRAIWMPLTILAILIGVAGAWPQIHEVQATRILCRGRSADFWSRSSFAVIRVRRWKSNAAEKPHRKRGVTPSQASSRMAVVEVLAVLATERIVPTNLELVVNTQLRWAARDRDEHTALKGAANTQPRPRGGMIYPGGVFLVYMTRGARGRWTLPGNLGVPSIMPGGEESVRVAGLSDPIVRRVRARLEKLLAEAHARK